MIGTPARFFAVDTRADLDETPAMAPATNPDTNPATTHGFDAADDAADDVAGDAADDAHSPRPTPRPTGSVAARVALVRHRDAPDGDHLDLFIGPFDAASPPPADDRVARSWRLPLAAWDERTSTLRGGRYTAVATAPHRAAYLALDDARTLDGGRGRVEPLLRVDGWMLEDADGCVAEAGAYRLDLRRMAEGWTAGILIGGSA